MTFSGTPIAEQTLNWLIDNLVYHSGKPLFFSNSFFILFLLLFLVSLFLAGEKPKSRLWVILLFSAYFYYKNAGPGSWVIFFTGISSFLTGRIAGNTKTKNQRVLWVFFGISVNLLMLGFFKYNMFAEPLFSSFSTTGFSINGLLFPVGLSFYTFGNISYLVDVKRGTIPAEKSLWVYLGYITFFPIVQMGPIERAGNIIPRLAAPVRPDKDAIREGTLLIVSGLIKKMVIGDYLNHHLVMNIFSAPERFTGIENIAAIFGYSMVIYCDFSGYTDIARGIARWAGFSPTLNFNLPYKSKNIGEFWRRWHISLSSWLRDYLFMPVALKLSGWMKRDLILNIPWLKTEQVIFWIASIVTFFICGIWHGTGTNFIIWGLMHGLALSVQKSWNQSTRDLRKKQTPFLRKVNRRAGILLTFLFVSTGWVFFRMATPEEVILVFTQVFRHLSISSFPAMLTAYNLPLLMLAAAYTWHFLPDNLLARGKAWLMQANFLTILSLSILLIISIFYFQKLGSSQPIYIRF